MAVFDKTNSLVMSPGSAFTAAIKTQPQIGYLAEAEEEHAEK